MQDSKLHGMVRAYCSAYENSDRITAEQLLSDDFIFTSPNDNAIDRATYFARCWPDQDAARDQQIETIVVDGERAFVTYSCSSGAGQSFRNTEFLTFTGDRIASVHVYFGAAYQDGAFL